MKQRMSMKDFYVKCPACGREVKARLGLFAYHKNDQDMPCVLSMSSVKREFDGEGIMRTDFSPGRTNFSEGRTAEKGRTDFS